MELGSGTRRGRVGVVLGSTPCRVGRDPTRSRFDPDAEAEAMQKREKMFVDALYAHSPGVPAENTWTHTGANFTQTILRTVSFGVGSQCELGMAALMSKVREACIDNIDVDAGSTEVFFANRHKHAAEAPWRIYS